mgnify:FL=1
MSRQEVFDEVQKIFQAVFDDDELMISDSTNSDDIEDWNSLEHINLIIAMEKRSQLKFDIKEVGKLKDVGEMIDLIERKLNE